VEFVGCRGDGKYIFNTKIKCKLKYLKTNRIEIIIIIMATIIDKAREYSPDNNESKDAFLNGALWMLEKAIDWLQGHVNDYLFDDGTPERPWLKCKSEMFVDFKKAMEK
jgi:hypothetical protein